MDQTAAYGQQNFNLPHDVVKLPSKGVFYKPKKESLKIGYLTASDENLLMSQNSSSDNLITTLLRNKVYEPGFDINQLLNTDVQAILIFLRNTSFGPEYNISVKDPVTGTYFETTLMMDAIDFEKQTVFPDENGLFTFKLPKSNKEVKFKLLSLADEKEIENFTKSYPQGMVAPTVTKRLEKHIVEIDGEKDKGNISQFILQMPIMDSKELKKFIDVCEPKLDLKRTVIAPSGEKVTVNMSFGVEFFRPFF
jgi:hypothetical protein